MRILVTAGPTHEHLDPVRYLANASTGKMGVAIARGAKRRGHRVVLVTGPTSARLPEGVRTHHVVSAQEMRRATLRELPRSQCLIMAAAVADYRPAKKSRRKIPKGPERWNLSLRKNPDILAEAARRPGRRVIAGFALETARGEARARRKMREKGLDFIVLDSPAAIGSDRISFRILFPDGSRRIYSALTKAVAAFRILDAAEEAHDRLRKGNPQGSR